MESPSSYDDVERRLDKNDDIRNSLVTRLAIIEEHMKSAEKNIAEIKATTDALNDQARYVRALLVIAMAIGGIFTFVLSIYDRFVAKASGT
jgi:septal ring factor EnvC (AmiA/AmiB activator)